MNDNPSFPQALHGGDADAALQRGSYACVCAPEDLVVLDGPDATELLHRISASSVRDIGEKDARTLLFTDDKGSLIAAPLAWRDGEAWVLAAGEGRGPVLEEWIDRWILNDQVRSRRGLAPAVLALMLQPSDESAVLSEIGFDVVRRGSKSRSGGGSTLIVPESAAHGPTLLIPDAVEEMLGLLQRLPLVDSDAAREAAVKAGRVECGPALVFGPNPLELGWKDRIAFDKGCYIGQEVIARMDTYDKVARRLAFVHFATRVLPGKEFRFEGKRGGFVLDIAHEHERTLALVVADRKIPDGSPVTGTHEEAGTLQWIPAPGAEASA